MYIYWLGRLIISGNVLLPKLCVCVCVVPYLAFPGPLTRLCGSHNGLVPQEVNETEVTDTESDKQRQKNDTHQGNLEDGD